MPITRYDRSPLEQAILERDRFQDEVCRLRADLKLHKEALEKAGVVLGEISKLKSGAGECALAWCIATNSLSTTCGNSLLEHLKEARELLGEVDDDFNDPSDWTKRRDTWLKGTP